MVLISDREPIFLTCSAIYCLPSTSSFEKWGLQVPYFIELWWRLNDVILVKCLLKQYLEHSKDLIDVNGDGGGDVVYPITLYASFIGTYRQYFPQNLFQLNHL